MDMDLAATPAYVPAYHPRLALKLALPPLSATTPTHPRAASPPTSQATVKKAEKDKAAGCSPPVITRVLDEILCAWKADAHEAAATTLQSVARRQAIRHAQAKVMPLLLAVAPPA